jgi:RNA polymerase sigma factor (sigma-70 family)
LVDPVDRAVGFIVREALAAPPGTSPPKAWDWPHLRGVALAEVRRTLGRTEIAEDAAQETVIRAWRRADTCRDPARPEPWLRAIARREALRALSRSPVAGEMTDDVPAQDDPADRIDSDVDVRRALAELTPAEREVVVRHYWQDKRCEEIAHELACPPGTVKVRLHRARNKLRAILDEGREPTS